MESIQQQEVVATTAPVVEIPITIRLHAKDYDRILATKQNFPKVCGFLAEQYARGGILVRAGQISQLEKLAGTSIKTPEAIMQIVENGVSRRSANGNLTVTYSVDSAFAEPLEQIAKSQGRDVDAIVQEACAIVFTNSWLYSIEVSGGTLHLTKEMRLELERAIGRKQLTGADVVAWAKEASEKRVSKKLQEVRARLDQKEEPVGV
jgi:hypothetical protein